MQPVLHALEILDEVLAALGAAHSAGVIHRDVKPSNIFLVRQPDGTSYVKLLDFGVSKMKAAANSSRQPRTSASLIVGTPTYIAPEQARGLPVDARSDLYSLGVTAYEMLTGRLPFEHPDAFEVIHMHLTQRPAPISKIRAGVAGPLETLIGEMLDKEPGRRPPSAQIVRTQIARMRAETPALESKGRLIALQSD